MAKLFDAFFWIEPTRSNTNAIFDSTRVIWHYPDDVSHVVKEFRDIPQFCFPDIEKTRIQKVENTKNEHFIFTLTDKDGNRSYGVCLRSLFRGEGRRYDVKRRPKHCLCFITKYPYFQIFKLLLLQLHGITLIQKNNHLPARNVLEQIYHQINLLTDKQPGVAFHFPITTFDKNILSLYPFLPSLHLTLPMYDQVGSRQDASILPLLESLGIETFLLVLTATLNEQRIIFIATEAETLSSTMLALISVLYPFHWQFLFLPLLPTKLITYACAPYPYLIGIRRYQLPYLNKEAELGDVIMVDIDHGECTTRGNVIVRDIIGDSNTTLKQASETFELLSRTAGGFASKFMKNLTSGSSGGGTSTASSVYSNYSSSSGGNNNTSLLSSNSNNNMDGNNSNNNGNNIDFTKDVMVTIISDLKSLLNSKPGSLSLTALTRGVLPTGLSKTSTEAARIQWELDGEKTVRDSLLLFFLYLFGDLEEAVNNNVLIKQQQEYRQQQQLKNNNNNNNNKNPHDDFEPSQSSSSSSTTTRNHMNNKHKNIDAFDFNVFIHRKQRNNDNLQIQGFLNDFLQSQMFQQYCDEKFKKLVSSTNSAASSNSSSNNSSSSMNNKDESNNITNEENIFDIIVADLKSKRLLPTIDNIKAGILNYHNIKDMIQSGCDQSYNTTTTNSSSNNSNSNNDVDASSKLKGLNLHSMTIHLTGGTLTPATLTTLINMNTTTTTKDNSNTTSSNNNSKSLMMMVSNANNRRGSHEYIDYSPTSGGSVTGRAISRSNDGSNTSGGSGMMKSNKSYDNITSSSSSSSSLSSSNSNTNNTTLTASMVSEQATMSICLDSYTSVHFLQIMQTLYVRLICCKAAGGRGSAGLAGKRALILLRALLVDGAESVLSYSVDFIPTIRGLIALNNSNYSSSGGNSIDGSNNNNMTINIDKSSSSSSSSSSLIKIQTQPSQTYNAFDMMSISTNYSIEIHLYATAVLRLILDHNLLYLQRCYSIYMKSSEYQFIQSLNHFNNNNSSNSHTLLHHQYNGKPRDFLKIAETGRFPSFLSVHNKFKPPVNISGESLMAGTSGSSGANAGVMITVLPTTDYSYLQLTKPQSFRDGDENENDNDGDYDNEEQLALPPVHTIASIVIPSVLSSGAVKPINTRTAGSTAASGTAAGTGPKPSNAPTKFNNSASTTRVTNNNTRNTNHTTAGAGAGVTHPQSSVGDLLELDYHETASFTPSIASNTHTGNNGTTSSNNNNGNSNSSFEPSTSGTTTSSTIVDDSFDINKLKYRVVNKDTGEMFDIRTYDFDAIATAAVSGSGGTGNGSGQKPLKFASPADLLPRSPARVQAAQSSQSPAAAVTPVRGTTAGLFPPPPGSNTISPRIAQKLQTNSNNNNNNNNVNNSAINNSFQPQQSHALNAFSPSTPSSNDFTPSIATSSSSLFQPSSSSSSSSFAPSTSLNSASTPSFTASSSSSTSSAAASSFSNTPNKPTTTTTTTPVTIKLQQYSPSVTHTIAATALSSSGTVARDVTLASVSVKKDPFSDLLHDMKSVPKPPPSSSATTTSFSNTPQSSAPNSSR